MRSGVPKTYIGNHQDWKMNWSWDQARFESGAHPTGCGDRDLRLPHGERAGWDSHKFAKLASSNGQLGSNPRLSVWPRSSVDRALAF